MPLSARNASSAARAASPSLRERRDELRPRADETGVREVEDRPEVAEAVLDGRAGERDARARGDPPELLRGLAGGVLDRLRLVEDQL